MATTRRSSNVVVARELITITVGARPAEYRPITVTHKRTGERVEILDTDNPPVDPGELGTPYVFKAGERVPKGHPAVAACPGAFISLEEAEEDE